MPDMVTLTGVKLISRKTMPDMVTLTGVKLISREEVRGYPELKIQTHDGDILTMRTPSDMTLPREGNYGRDALLGKLQEIQGDTVDVTYGSYVWELGNRSGTILYFVDIKES